MLYLNRTFEFENDPKFVLCYVMTTDIMSLLKPKITAQPNFQLALIINIIINLYYYFFKFLQQLAFWSCLFQFYSKFILHKSICKKHCLFQKFNLFVFIYHIERQFHFSFILCIQHFRPNKYISVCWTNSNFLWAPANTFFFNFPIKNSIIVKKGEFSGSLIGKITYVIRKFIKTTYSALLW